MEEGGGVGGGRAMVRGQPTKRTSGALLEGLDGALPPLRMRRATDRRPNVFDRAQNNRKVYRRF